MNTKNKIVQSISQSANDLINKSTQLKNQASIITEALIDLEALIDGLDPISPSLITHSQIADAIRRLPQMTPAQARWLSEVCIERSIELKGNRG